MIDLGSIAGLHELHAYCLRRDSSVFDTACEAWR